MSSKKAESKASRSNSGGSKRTKKEDRDDEDKMPPPNKVPKKLQALKCQIVDCGHTSAEAQLDSIYVVERNSHVHSTGPECKMSRHAA